MTAIPDDELLSAYLDGELTADDSARVERLLAERPESRQLLEDLRLVRESLQALPRRRLDDDFSQHVLRQAEREVLHSGPDADPVAERAGQGNLLTAGNVAARDESANGEKTSAAASPSQAFDWQRMRRPAAWAALALAAGLLIMFMSPQDKRAGQRQVAHHAAPRGEAEQRPAVKDQSRREERPEMHAAPAGDLSSVSGKSGSAGIEDQPDETAELHKRSLDEKAARDERAVEPPANAPSGPQSARFARRAPRAKDSSADATTLGIKGGEQATLGLAETAPAIDDQTLIVWCEVAPDGDYRANFDKLLAAQQIEWQDTDGDATISNDTEISDGAVSSLQRSTRRRQSSVYFAESANKPAGVDVQRLVETLQRRAEQESESVDRQPPLDALREPATELVLVEASESQIKAMLAGLDKRPNTYPAVRVEPAAGQPRQQSLKQFERGAIASSGRAPRPRREAKQSAEEFRASDELDESAKSERGGAIRAGAEFKSGIEGSSKKEQLSSDHAQRALGRAQRVLLERTSGLPNDASGRKKVDESADGKTADDAETDSSPPDSPRPDSSAKKPAAGAATPPPPAPAARGLKQTEKTLADEPGDGDKLAAGKRPQALGRKLATQESVEEDAAEGEDGEATAKPAPRVYRVLFVFHPQPADGGTPASAAPARPANSETPEE